MMIRTGLQGDVFRLIELGRRFWATTAHADDVPTDDESMARVILHCISQDLMAVVEHPEKGIVGFACGQSFPCVVNRDYLFGSEIAYYLEPAYRGGPEGRALLEYLEILAKEAGITKWTMLCMEKPDPTPAIKLYERHGYELQERSYTKTLT